MSPAEPKAIRLDRERPLRRLVEAYFAALAGDGHPDEPHDHLLHEVGRHDETCPGNRGDDCSNCAGQTYGTESDLHDYLAATGSSEESVT